ncbi:MAG: hypothetical protein ACE5FA_06110 [Dehalococcoidia bacterium]
MPEDSKVPAHITSVTPSEASVRRCAFCQDGLPAGGSKQYRGELLCVECAKIALTAHGSKKPTSTVAARAAEIDTYSMSNNRIALVGIGSLVLIAASAIGSIPVYQGTRDTWERDNADAVLAVASEAQTLLDGGDRVAALAKYEQLNGLVGGRTLEDERLRQAVKTARERKLEIEQSLTAEEDRRRKEQEAAAQEEARKRREVEAAEQRRREEERQRKEEARRQELARKQAQERREQEARDNPIGIDDIGVKLVDIPLAEWDWCNYSWKATVTNRTSLAITLTVVLTLYDDEGFVLETDRKYGVVIGAGASKVVSNQSQMKLSVFKRTEKYGVSVN